VRVTFRIRDLVVASWSITEAEAARLLPTGLEPAPIGDEHLISLVAMRHESRPRHAQINLRTYVTWKGDEDAVYFLLTRVTVPGLVGVLLGAPYAPSRISVRRGAVEAPGLGVSLRYEVGESAEPGPIGRHELGIFGRSRLRAVRIRRSPAIWRRAEAAGEIRADPVLFYGIGIDTPPNLLYTAVADLELEGRPRRLRFS
jgi:hypothetical protein